MNRVIPFSVRAEPVEARIPFALSLSKGWAELDALQHTHSVRAELVEALRCVPRWHFDKLRANGGSRGHFDKLSANGSSHGHFDKLSANGSSHGHFDKLSANGGSHGHFDKLSANGGSRGHFDKLPANGDFFRSLFEVRRALPC